MGAGAEGRGQRRPAGRAGMSETWSRPGESGVLVEKTRVIVSSWLSRVVDRVASTARDE